MKYKNYKIWSATDGSKGMISQANGLAKNLSSNITEIKTELIFPWNKLQPGILPSFKWIFKNDFSTKNLPDIIITCGRKSVYFSLYLKKISNNIINIHIQNPKIRYNKFNYIIAPNHDEITGKNVINSIGALHHIDLNNISRNDLNLSIPNNKLVSCIIGGQNNHYHFRKYEIIDLCEKLIKLKENNPAINLLIITSRRTDKSFIKIIRNKMNDKAILGFDNFKNPYLFALKHSIFFILTSDSTSMISESAVTGKPIYVYHLPFKRKSKRIENFHNEFENLNITRNFDNTLNLKNWNYNHLNETKRIAGIIKKRIIEDLL